MLNRGGVLGTLKALAIALSAIWMVASSERARAEEDPYIGQIVLFGTTFCPRGWALADGSLLPVAQNSALFALLGTTYGGDGRSTFALPNFPQPHGLRYCVAMTGIYPSRP